MTTAIRNRGSSRLSPLARFVLGGKPVLKGIECVMLKPTLGFEADSATLRSSIETVQARRDAKRVTRSPTAVGQGGID